MHRLVSINVYLDDIHVPKRWSAVVTTLADVHALTRVSLSTVAYRCPLRTLRPASCVASSNVSSDNDTQY